MSLHKLTAGDGYTYLTRQVAAGDATERGYSSLGDYYSAKGEAPGVWMGRGLETLGVFGAVTELQMKNLFGQGIHPDAEKVAAESIAAGHCVPVAQAAGRLGAKFPVFEINPAWHDELAAAYRAYNLDNDQEPGAAIAPEDREQVRTQVANRLFERQHSRAPVSSAELSGFISQQSRPDRTAVAGYDVTFSPVKSVSTLWAVAPTEVSEKIEAAHRAAVEKTVAWIEKEAGYTRVGNRSVGQVQTRGLVMAAFTHRDSRAGDPDLHTHVAISNKVQRLGADGQWQALDGRMLYRITVGASEFYNTQLEIEVTQRVGAVFADRTSEAGKRPIREIVGVDERLNAAWSTRRAAITTARTELTKTFLAQHGRVPTTVEMVKLSQRATLATREAKHEPRSLGEQRETWHEQAVEVLGGHTELGRMLAAATGQQTGEAAPVTHALVTELAAATVQSVAGSRATWRETNLDAEARRQVRYAGVHPTAMQDLADQVAARAAGSEHSVRIGMDSEVGAPVPAPLTRSDGQSMFRMAKGQLYTSPAILNAEARVLAAAGQLGGRVLDAGDVQIAQLEWSANNGGAVLNTAQAAMVTDIATNPRMVQLALAPAGTGKTTVMGVLARAWMSTGGHIVGLAPQASAAKELAAAIPGVEADTIDKLVHDLAQTPQDRWLPWMTRIGPDSLIVLDEAGLASTPKLDTVIGFVTGRGGRVLLVGDDQQRAAAGAGGLLRDIESTHGAVTLTEVLRFTDPLDGKASLALRAGDPSVVGHWADKNRIEAVTPDTAAGQVYQAWAADSAAGADSIMIAPTLAMVTTLNEQARAARLAAQDGDVGPEIQLPNGETVSAGDVIITKQNKRNLSLGGTDFVKNNHRWTVNQVHPDGALTATELSRGVTRTIPAWYVSSGWVRLGYASTHASVQGITVGKAGVRRGTAHAVIVAGMTRNELYPALTRATDGTRSYVVLGGEGNSHDVTTPGAIEPLTAVEVLVKIVETDGAARSVTTERREAADPARRLGQAADAYTHSIVVGAETVVGAQGLTRMVAEAEAALPGITANAAWEALRGHLVVLAAGGVDPIDALTAAAASRELGTARDISAVLDYRLDPSGNHSQGRGPLPWLPSIPQAVAELPGWNSYLHARAELVGDLAGQIRARAAGWNAATAPAWALPYLPDPALVGELAAWRAAESVPDTDLRPAGPTPRRIAMIRRHTDLVQAALAVGGDARDGVDRWAAVLHDKGIHIVGDDYWPVLAARLSLADAAGINVPALLGAATAGAPLPAEGPAGALWWRLAPHIGDLAAAATTNGNKLRPPWTAALDDILPVATVDRITSDRLWPVIVARVDQAARDGHNAHTLISDAAWMLTGHAAGLADHEQPTILMWNLDILTGPEPADHDLDKPIDPQSADLLAPDDAHQDFPEPVVVSTLAEPEPDEPEEAVDPFDAARSTTPADLEQDLPDPVDPDEQEPDELDIVPPPDAAAVLPPPIRQWSSLTEPVADDHHWSALARNSETAPGNDLVDATGRSREALTAAQAFFTEKAPNSWVPGYLTRRGLDPAAAGYAPGRTTLIDHLRDQGFSDQELLAAGLARTSERGGVYDFFRNRLTYPYTDPDGQVVGFLTRKPPGDTNAHNPKYLNSPESELFHKRALPFGLDPAAVTALRGGADVVLVEGPMDAMAVNTATGRAALVAVATGGTALTADHLATLNSIAPLADRQVLVLMDNDAAGDTAAVAAHAVLARAGINAPATLLPLPVKDAAQLLQDHGPQALRAALTDRRPLEDLVVDRIEKVHAAHQRPQDVGTIEARLQVLYSAAPHVAAMTDEQQQRQALRLADKLNLSIFNVLDTIDEHRAEPAPRPQAAPADLGLPTPPVLRSRRDEPTQHGPTQPHLPEQPGTLALLEEPVTPAVEPAPEQSVDTDAGSTAVTTTLEPENGAAPAPDVAISTPAEPAADRQYQDLTDTDLDLAARAAAGEHQQATQAAEQAQADALAIAQGIADGRGPATEQLAQQTAGHQQYLADVTTFQKHLQNLRDTQAQHHEAAGHLHDATTELAGLGKLAGRRRTELAQRIQQVQAEQGDRLERIAAAAAAVAPLQQRLGDNPRQAQQRIDAATAHLARRHELQNRAAEQDRQLANETAQRAESLTAAVHRAADNAARYATEQQHRIQHPEAVIADNSAAAQTAPAATSAPGPADDNEHRPDLDWTYRPEIEDAPPTPDDGIQR